MGNCISVSISFDSVFSHCQSCIAETAAYQFNLEDNLEALQTEMEKLIEARDSLMMRVNDAEKNHMKRTKQVQRWLSKVQIVETEVGELLKVKSEETNKLCLGGFCSKNCKSSYKFGKKVARKLQTVTSLKGGGAFEVVAERVESVVDERPSEPIMVGIQSTFDKVWRCLGKANVGVIGIYGMPGVGKTTLLTKIHNKFVDTPRDFDIVIWIVVSKNLQLGEIQDTIGKKIGLLNESWKNKEFDEKAEDIFKNLKKKKFVIMLDDIWERVDLMKIGIPLPTPQNSSKVIFTTRILEVSGKMDAHKELKVECLTHKDAWELFQKKVGEETLESHPRIRALAETVTKECGGLPLALITIGRAMARKKMPEEWEYAIQILRRSASKFAGMENEVYHRLKFSYDNLPNDKIKSCLLYCSLFPEDYTIHKKDLTDYWISEGFLDDNDRSGAQNEGYHVIGILLHSCLLEEFNKDLVKMHDVIRDMSLWIACEIERENHNFLVKAGVKLNEVPEIREWERVKRLSLIKNQIEELTVTPFCPHLITFFVNRNHLKVIASDFFRFMPSLRILDLSNNRDLKEIPSGISKLVSLQHLDVSYTAIRELPEELKALVNLKCLILEDTPNLHMIPLELIPSFSKLNVLRMFSFRTPIKVAEHSALFGSCEVLIEEILCLKNLSELTINLKSSPAFARLLSSRKLHSCILSLHLIYFDDATSLDVLSLAEMVNLKRLEISSCEKLEELEIDYARRVREPHAFRNLAEVLVFRCWKLRDLTWLVFAPNLSRLLIAFCSSMEEIISFDKLGEDPEIIGNLNPFSKLRYLSLQDLKNLKSIYKNALPFPHLKRIVVRHCPELKKLQLPSEITKQRRFSIAGGEHWWKELQWEDEATRDAFLPCFKSIED